MQLVTHHLLRTIQTILAWYPLKVSQVSSNFIRRIISIEINCGQFLSSFSYYFGIFVLKMIQRASDHLIFHYFTSSSPIWIALFGYFLGQHRWLFVWSEAALQQESHNIESSSNNQQRQLFNCLLWTESCIDCTCF